MLDIPVGPQLHHFIGNEPTQSSHHSAEVALAQPHACSELHFALLAIAPCGVDFAHAEAAADKGDGEVAFEVEEKGGFD